MEADGGDGGIVDRRFLGMGFKGLSDTASLHRIYIYHNDSSLKDEVHAPMAKRKPRDF